MSSPSYHKSASAGPTIPTHIAAQQNDVSLLAEYVQDGQELIDEETGENPFHSAARGGSIEAIKWLLENRPSDISPRHKANNGHTPAHAAAVYNHMEALKMILEHDKVKGGLMAADQDENGLTILHLAVLQGDEHMVKYILKNYPHLAFCANESGDLPVHFAAASGYLEILKILVDTGGSHIVNERDSNGEFCKLKLITCSTMYVY
jgi:ankyrin repeat protein